MLSRTQFVGSRFGWVHSSVLVDELGFGSVRSLVFPDLGLGSASFWPNSLMFRLFKGFNWVQSSFLTDEPGFE